MKEDPISTHLAIKQDLPDRALRKRQSTPVSLDVVIPIFNEDQIIEKLFGELETTFSPERLGSSNIRSVRYIFVDDGSTDQSAYMIQHHICAGTNAALYRFSRNFGHQSAVCAGMRFSQADVTAIIDADLQDPPSAIFPMIEKWRAGFDIVYGIRRKRKENPFKRFGYWAFYRLLSFLAEIDIPCDSGDFCLLDRNALAALNNLPEHLRFPRVLRAWVGFRQTGLIYERSPRVGGKPKYNFGMLYRLATDGLASASIRPLKIAQFFSITYLAAALFLASIILSKFVSYDRNNELALWSLFGYLLIVAGSFVQTGCIYILGAYIGRIYIEAKHRPPYIIMESVGATTTEPEETR